ncbi:MAG: hypothetical protein CMM45_07460 [Rhodospirillaceae bacterium]|nr:hypothetical protein [Rhodospirillaceae bacterium]
MASEFSILEAYEKMIAVRAFENCLLESFSGGELTGTTHTCLGQEPNAVGVAMALEHNDIIVSNHRSHGHFLAHVGDFKGLMAEIMGKQTGVCGGKGGSQHLAVPGRFYANGIQGGIVPLATGLAIGRDKSGSKNIVTVFVGDGTFGEGVVYEALNIAAVHQAPLLVVVENNGIAQTTPSHLTTSGSFEARFEAFSIPCLTLDHPLVDDVYEAAVDKVAKTRDGRGPHALVLNSIRLGPHSKGDDTRTELELARGRDLDPVVKTQSMFSNLEINKALDMAQSKVKEAYNYALSSPPASPVASRDAEATVPIDADTAAILNNLEGQSFVDQINQGLHQLLAGNKNAILLGEDILDPYGGAFKVTSGLSTRYGGQVFPMPISEAGMVGVAGGLAIQGFIPIVEIMFGDFLCLAMDQIVNHLAHYRDMYDNQVAVPVIIRTPMGGRRGYGPSHSQTLDKHFFGASGLRVLAPTHLHPIAEMLADSSKQMTPTLFIENKVLYSQSVERTGEDMVEDFFVRYRGGANSPTLALSMTEFEDEDATILCYGGMLPVAIEAARNLLIKNEISCRIVAPSILYPLDHTPLIELMTPNGPIVTVEESAAPFGFGAEIAALLAEVNLLYQRKFGRVGASEQSIAAARTLEDEILPQSDDIIQAVIQRL